MRIRVGEEDVVIVRRCHDYSATSSKLNPLVVLIVVVVVVVTVEKEEEEEEEEKNDETKCSYVGMSLGRPLDIYLEKIGEEEEEEGELEMQEKAHRRVNQKSLALSNRNYYS